MDGGSEKRYLRCCYFWIHTTSTFLMETIKLDKHVPAVMADLVILSQSNRLRSTA